MKKIVTFILLMCMIMTFAACGKAEITMQEIYDASKTEAMLENHESVYFINKMDGEIWRETYLTKDYAFDYIPNEEFPWIQFMTDDACYNYDSGNYLRYLFITPDGIGDFVSEREENYASLILGEDVLDDIIESVSNKDGRITATCASSSKDLEAWAEYGVTGGKHEYVLDAKNREIISFTSDYTYEDGSVSSSITELTYDAEAPEMAKTFLNYVNQTEDLRNVTIVSNPGTEKEISQNFQAPKGLIIGFTWADAFEDKVVLYSDAACTALYDPYVNTDSDLTVYVKWIG